MLPYKSNRNARFSRHTAQPVNLRIYLYDVEIFDVKSSKIIGMLHIYCVLWNYATWSPTRRETQQWSTIHETWVIISIAKFVQKAESITANPLGSAHKHGNANALKDDNNLHLGQ
jgi:hypothetical protein